MGGNALRGVKCSPGVGSRATGASEYPLRFRGVKQFLLPAQQNTGWNDCPGKRPGSGNA